MQTSTKYYINRLIYFKCYHATAHRTSMHLLLKHNEHVPRTVFTAYNPTDGHSSALGTAYPTETQPELLAAQLD